MILFSRLTKAAGQLQPPQFTELWLGMAGQILSLIQWLLISEANLKV